MPNATPRVRAVSLKGTGKFTWFFRVFIKANLEHQVVQAIVSKTWTKRLKTYLTGQPEKVTFKLNFHKEINNYRLQFKRLHF